MVDNYWSGRKVLITGVNGFVGSNLAKELVEHKADVVGIIRDYLPASYLFYTGTNEKITMVPGDITDLEVVKRAINQYEIDTIFHLAAQAIVTQANRSPVDTFHSNIIGTANILEAARTSGLVKRIVLASSDKAYGKGKSLPYVEDMPLEAEYPYDVSKACAEMIAKSYFHTYKLPVIITKFCNIFGEGDFNFSRIIPDTIRTVLENQRPIIRSDGSPIREYIHIGDVVKGYLTLAEQSDSKNLFGETFNLGSDEKISVLGLVKKIISLSGSSLEPEVLGRGSLHGEIDEQYLSSEKVKRVLGWKSEVSLDEGLKKSIDWYRSYFEKRG